jgi:hypothetical protein
VNIGAAELLIIGLIGIVPLVLGIVVAVDANHFPETAFRHIGTSKTLWIVLPIVGIFACGIITIVAAILWYASYRPKVAGAAIEHAAALAER